MLRIERREVLHTPPVQPEPEEQPRQGVFRWLNVGAAVLLVAEFFLVILHQLGRGDAVAIALNYVLLYSTVRVLVTRGVLGPSVRRLQDLCNIKWQLLIVVACVGILPFALLSGKPTARAYQWSVGIINGIFIGAALLMLLMDRSSEAGVHPRVVAPVPIEIPDGADKSRNGNQEEVEIAMDKDELPDDDDDEGEEF